MKMIYIINISFILPKNIYQKDIYNIKKKPMDKDAYLNSLKPYILDINSIIKYILYDWLISLCSTLCYINSIIKYILFDWLISLCSTLCYINSIIKYKIYII